MQTAATAATTHLPLLVLLVLAQAGLAVFVRALPWPKAWTKVKPIGCSVCMPGWAGFATIGSLLVTGDLRALPYSLLPLVWLAGVAVGALVFQRVYPPEIELPGFEQPSDKP